MKTISSFDWAAKELEDLKLKNLYRKFRVLEELKTTKAKIAGKDVTLFCGNDYLGLSQHPKLIGTFQKAAAEWGIGSGSARLISGTSKWHEALEGRIAQFLGKDRALLFSSGYLANLGVLSSLAGPNDLIVLDKLSHASLVDAAHLSKATVRVYPHKNLRYLERILESVIPAKAGIQRSLDPGVRRDDKRARRVWIVTDSVFSMDGDLAPLPELVELKNRYGAYLVIDEAHATGVFGPKGRGVSEHFGVSDSIDVHMGTLSKALGTVGGFVAGSTELIEYLINHARTFLFDTALPAPICAAALQAFDFVEQKSEFRATLWKRVSQLKKGLEKIGAPILETESPIIPIVFGDELKTLKAAEFLLKEGFLVPAVRYPTVPKGKARLRITVSANHSESEIDQFVSAFKRCLA
jgi:8-amino-7-oxononanoate synthase